ncbi:hypothetical protein BDR06DRAFT_1009632 [Suillus hirtellus]|nr:hypothetical protein BDR06DRAFT_1009632 [Suillus hirtellus]
MDVMKSLLYPLKKGTSPLAQRARSASRILKAQVGINTRIPHGVQRDDAFVPWDRIEFKDMSPDDAKDKAMLQSLHLSGFPDDRLIVVFAILSPSAVPAQVCRTEAMPEVSSPVPLPAPSPHTHKYEPRSAGLLIEHWATRAGITLLEVEPSAAPLVPPSSNHLHNLDGDDRGKRQAGRGRLERPAAVMQMMEVISQPSKVIRVLARGEKLEPDP